MDTREEQVSLWRWVAVLALLVLLFYLWPAGYLTWRMVTGEPYSSGWPLQLAVVGVPVVAGTVLAVRVLRERDGRRSRQLGWATLGCVVAFFVVLAAAPLL